MDFLRKNYEKVILSLVLLGLAAAAVFLLFQVSSERERLTAIQEMDITVPKKEFIPYDSSTNESLLRRLRRPEAAHLTREHNLFNPVRWQRRAEGAALTKEGSVLEGAAALTLTETKPLRLMVSYEGATGSGNQIFHKFKVTREADRDPGSRRATTLTVMGIGARNKVFVLKDLQPKEDPKEFTLEMVDDKTQVLVQKDKPFESVAGYTADLKYDPERQIYLNKRIDDRLVFGGDTNKIVAITSTSVTVEALSNKKRTTISIAGKTPASTNTAGK